MSGIRVLVADDHTFVRKGLKAVIENEPDMTVVAEARNGREAIEACATYKPQIAILDIAMPELNGIDATAQILKLETRTQVIVLSMHSDEAYVMRALSSGAKGYLLKDSAEQDVLSAIRQVSEGKPFFSGKIAATLLEDYVRYLRQRGLQDSYDLLTDREREVLQLIAEGRSNKEVATALNVGVTTVEKHRTNLMQKLDLHSSAEIVLYAVRKKLIV